MIEEKARKITLKKKCRPNYLLSGKEFRGSKEETFDRIGKRFGEATTHMNKGQSKKTRHCGETETGDFAETQDHHKWSCEENQSRTTCYSRESRTGPEVIEAIKRARSDER